MSEFQRAMGLALFGIGRVGKQEAQRILQLANGGLHDGAEPLTDADAVAIREEVTNRAGTTQAAAKLLDVAVSLATFS